MTIFTAKVDYISYTKKLGHYAKQQKQQTMGFLSNFISRARTSSRISTRLFLVSFMYFPQRVLTTYPEILSASSHSVKFLYFLLHKLGSEHGRRPLTSRETIWPRRLLIIQVCATGVGALGEMRAWALRWVGRSVVGVVDGVVDGAEYVWMAGGDGGLCGRWLGDGVVGWRGGG